MQIVTSAVQIFLLYIDVEHGFLCISRVSRGLLWFHLQGGHERAIPLLHQFSGAGNIVHDAILETVCGKRPCIQLCDDIRPELVVLVSFIVCGLPASPHDPVHESNARRPNQSVAAIPDVLHSKFARTGIKVCDEALPMKGSGNLVFWTHGTRSAQ